jgi:hypothetical protein
MIENQIALFPDHPVQMVEHTGRIFRITASDKETDIKTLETDILIDWKEPFKTGPFYYLKENRVRGILLWSNWGKLDQARMVVKNFNSIKPEDLVGSLND